MAVSPQHQPRQPHKAHISGPPISSTSASKRRRQPSVRLVEIEDPPIKHWIPTNRPTNTPSTNSSAANQEKRGNNDVNFKGFDHSKGPRTNWVSGILDEEGFARAFEMEGFSPLIKENPGHYSLNEEGELKFKGVDLEGHFDKGGPSVRGRGGGNTDGVRAWLDEVGLGRYWPVFEFHGVDDEVLPLLTLEDLKDMGIHAVGSKRKLFCAIQKLQKELYGLRVGIFS